MYSESVVDLSNDTDNNNKHNNNNNNNDNNNNNNNKDSDDEKITKNQTTLFAYLNFPKYQLVPKAIVVYMASKRRKVNSWNYYAHICRPFGPSQDRSLSLSMSWTWNIFTWTNTLKHAEFKSENFPLRKSAVFLQTDI